MKTTLFILIGIVLIVLVGVPVSAAPPNPPRTVSGRVFDSLGINGVPNGIPVRVNNTDLNQIFYTFTNAPNDPSLLGSYSLNINGTPNDALELFAWNATHYGHNISSLRSPLTTVNIKLNGTRTSEANTTLLSPLNHSSYHSGSTVFVNVSVMWLGQSGNGCSVNLTIQNSSVLTPYSGESLVYDAGSFVFGDTTQIVWNTTANLTGTTNISVRAGCDTDSRIFDFLFLASAKNITVFDTTAPNISILYPPNATYYANNTPLLFTYQVNDDIPIQNCTLFIDGIANQSDTNIERGTDLVFNESFASGNYTWEIQCTDSSSTPNTGSSGIYTLFIDSFAGLFPSITNMTIVNPIILSPQTNTTVTCNATVTDFAGADDIVSLNATLYHNNVTAASPDDYNNHYTNGSCTNVSSSGNEKHFSCSFSVTSFANSSTWYCSATALDSFNNTANSNLSTTLLPLLAVEVNPPVLDFGFVSPGQNSSFDIAVNITNLGNVPINISLQGLALFGGDGLSFDCSFGNISVSDQRYSYDQGIDFDSMVPLSSSSLLVQNFTISSRANDTHPYQDEQSSLFWKVRLPVAIGGRCNGTIIFTASQS